MEGKKNLTITYPMNSNLISDSQVIRRKAGSDVFDEIWLKNLENIKQEQGFIVPRYCIPIDLEMSKGPLHVGYAIQAIGIDHPKPKRPKELSPVKIKAKHNSRSESRSCEPLPSPSQIQKTSSFGFAFKKRLLDEYKIGKEIGKGGFSKVHSAIHKLTGESRAIKIIKKNSHRGKVKVDYGIELYILKQLNHPSIIKIHEVIESQEFVYIVLE